MNVALVSEFHVDAPSQVVGSGDLDQDFVEPSGVLFFQVEAVGLDVFTAVEQLGSTPVENVCAGGDRASGKPEKIVSIWIQVKLDFENAKQVFIPIKSIMSSYKKVLIEQSIFGLYSMVPH